MVRHEPAVRHEMAPRSSRRSAGEREVAADGAIAVSLRLPGVPRSASLARRFAADAVPLLFPDHDPAAAVILVNELVTHGVVHGQRQIELTLRSAGDALRLEVSDPGGDRAPVDPGVAHDDPAMGLQIVQSVSDRWGVDVSDGRSVIWCLLRGWDPLD